MRRLTAILLLFAVAAAPGAAPAPETCPDSGALAIPSLPRTHAALASNQPLLIVALGSSSTRGWMATNIAHSYPALLQRALNDALPQAEFAVINRGIGGQDAPEELARMETDVIATKPVLVIWQVGANGALRHSSPEGFRSLVEEGITELKATGADIILMDNQRSPRLLASHDDGAIDTTLADIARDSHVNLFSRGLLMDHWKASGADYDEFVATDGLHMNNRGYACLAEALAGVIVQGVMKKASASAKP